jgi:exonuclease III
MELAVMNWNVRGANSPAKRRALQLFFSDKFCNVVCLQETKIEVMTKELVVEMLGPRFGDNFIDLPADGTRGGVLIACTPDFQITVDTTTTASRFSISGVVVHRADLFSWTMTAVYGPQEDEFKQDFMREIRQVKALVQDKWMILGDFNLICSTEDKRNSNVNLRLMGQFRDLI